MTFRSEDLEVDLSDRRCLVTGANSGIGFETSRALADAPIRRAAPAAETEKQNAYNCGSIESC